MRDGLRRHGGDFAAYVEKRNPQDASNCRGTSSKFAKATTESVHYFNSEADLQQFSEANPDLGLFGEESDTSLLEKNGDSNGQEKSEPGKRNGPTRRARHIELHESKAVADSCWRNWPAKV